MHDLLDHLSRHAWPGAPRFLSIDELLSYLPGAVPMHPADLVAVRSGECLRRTVVLVRAFHDLTAGTRCAAGHEVVCHNDLSPRNTVYHDLPGPAPVPVGFIDWDLAAPGSRIHDLAHLCWQYLGLGPSVTDLDDTARALVGICDAYGLVDRYRLVDSILWWQQRCWRGIRTGAEAGDPALIRLRDRGAVDEVRAAHDWTAAHRTDLADRIRSLSP